MTFICYVSEVDIIKMVMMPFNYVKYAYHLSLSGPHLDTTEGWMIYEVMHMAHQEGHVFLLSSIYWIKKKVSC